MRFSITIVLVLIYSIGLKAQNTYNNVHGTLILVATGKDGIMLAVDSRLTLTDKDKTIGLVDSIDKIYTLKGFSVCYEGTGILDSNRFLSASFSEYNKLHRKKQSFSEAVKGYVDFMKTRYEKQLNTSLKNNAFVFAGYENNKPHITLWTPADGEIRFNDSDTIMECTHEKIKTYFGPYDPQSSCAQMSVQAVKAMQRYIDEDKSFAAGKPFKTIMIRPNNTTITLNNFRGKQFYTTAAFNTAINKKQITLFMIKEDN
ncbi:hypothetical protein I5907_00775 [Panacibacter sp. DH6]|uniref:Uncharacterized protein n=1 Tax=Panacibacter microcysteis TaxID=2793269 RepID=A0A931E4C7_9BACT|nr:hypothetical protein [Panacibacter microcysteis]MBG9374753.1 hypothetical protein [Panacibacter microcysteis]